MKNILLIATIFICTTSLATPKLHVIISADSNATDIGVAVNYDKNNFRKLFSGIADHFNASAFYSISANNLSKKSIKIKIDSIIKTTAIQISS